MDDWTPTALMALLVASVVAEFGAILQFIAVVTAMTSLTARSVAVLRGASKKEVDRFTSFGFVMGLIVSGGLYLIDAVI